MDMDQSSISGSVDQSGYWSQYVERWEGGKYSLALQHKTVYRKNYFLDFYCIICISAHYYYIYYETQLTLLPNMP